MQTRVRNNKLATPIQTKWGFRVVLNSIKASMFFVLF